MDKDMIKFKLKLTEDKIKVREEIMKWSKGTDKQLICIGICVLIMILVITSVKPKLIALDVLSISLVTSALYKLITDSISNRRDDLHKINLLNLDKKYYQGLLNIKEDEEYENNKK